MKNIKVNHRKRKQQQILENLFRVYRLVYRMEPTIYNGTYFFSLSSNIYGTKISINSTICSALRHLYVYVKMKKYGYIQKIEKYIYLCHCNGYY